MRRQRCIGAEQSTTPAGAHRNAAGRAAAVLVAAVLANGALPAAGRAADACDNPTFRIPASSPFNLPVAGARPTALAAGTYVARPGLQLGCGCDLAIAVTNDDDPTASFVALMRGNENGSFTFNPDTVFRVSPNPVAMASGRFRKDVAFDGVVAVTNQPGENGRVHVFVPDQRGVYAPPQTEPSVFGAGPDAVAIATGDFNGDGELDVAIANRGNSSLTILFGTGTGTFLPNAVSVPNLGGIPESITAGKFSGSSAVDDIAVSVLENVAGSGRIGVVIVSASGTGTLAAKPIIRVGQPNSLHSSIVAANLSGAPEGTPSRRRTSDLAIAYTDRTPGGDPIGRVKVLLGKPNGGFGDVATAQTIDLGAFPRSIMVADLDDDGVVDLIVSTFGDAPSQLDGTVHFFQGRAAPGPDVGFNANLNWFTIPATTGIRPRALVAGRFGRNRPAEPPASMGVAAINAPSLSSVNIFLGNGQGAFVQPSQVTTAVGAADSLFVAGDFHSTDGKSPLLDLAFVTKVNQNNLLGVLLSNGAGGFERLAETQQFILAGSSPRLIAAGPFVAEGPLGIAIVDETGSLGAQPLLKMFLGQGDGRFKAGPELSLSQIGRPRALAIGNFRGAGTPLDIAIAADTTPSGSTVHKGRLTVLFGDGTGAFTVGATQELDFAPGSMAASSRLQHEGKTDLLIRDANSNRFQFLVNIDNGHFRPADGPNGGFFSGAGDFDTLLVGEVATRNPPDALDDVVTFDSDMTLKVFINNGRESFDSQPAIRPNHPNLQGAQPPYVAADFGSGKLGLAALVGRAQGIGLALLQANDAGVFTVASAAVPLSPIGGAHTGSSTTQITQSSPGLFHTLTVQIAQAMAGQFRSALHGNSKSDLGFIFTATEDSLVAGMCASDPRVVPSARPLPRPTVCRQPDPIQDCPPSARPCFSGDCCHCTTGPPRGRCPMTCDLPEGPPVPFAAFCRSTQSFAPVLTVYGNTCGD